MAHNSLFDMSTTAASNTSVEGVTTAEGMPPSAVNDAMRAMISQSLGALKTVAGGGTADAITATLAPAPDALTDGLMARVRATAANATTTPNFAPNGLTAHTIVKTGGVALAVGDSVGALHELVMVYNAANTRWELLNPNAVAGVTSIADATNGGLAFSGSTGAVTANIAPGDATAKSSPTSSDLVLIGDAASSNALKKSTIAQVQAVAGWKGSLTAGTSVTLNPYAIATTSGAVAHGLGAKPDFIHAYLECITGELGYSAGDRISLGQIASANGAVSGAMVNYDATNCTIVTANETNNPILAAKTGGTVGTSFLTAANWKVVAIPYKLN